MKPANLAPIYVGVYPGLAEVCREKGYALAVHGSVGKDFDLIAVPWTIEAVSPTELINSITTKFAFQVIGDMNKPVLHGRLCTTLSFSFGECYLDFSIIPPAKG